MTEDQTQTDERSPEFNSVINQVQDQLTSRRGFLAGSAAAGVGALGVSGLAGATDQEGESGDMGEGGDMSSGGSWDDPSTDVDVLNYALTLEHLEDAFYQHSIPSREAIMSAESLQGFPDHLLNSVYENVQLIGEHESTHVDVLMTVIETLGGTPVGPAEYDFGLPENEMAPMQFLATAKALENTGVMAYAGALDLIESPDLQTAAATVATVEARHASYLNLLNGDTPFPNAFDEAKSREEILSVANQFIVE
jgi:hypothetical protein